jgi:hypothetical protein
MKYNNYKNYQEAATNIHKLVGICDEQNVRANEQRQQRRLNVDLDLERRDGYLAPDEIYIPTHIIDTNIRREQAKYVSYIVNSRRTAIFSSSTDPAFNTGPLERDFTERSRYDGWQIPLFRVIDCMQLHGYCIAEVEFDDTKPGHFGIEKVMFRSKGIVQVGWSCAARCNDWLRKPRPLFLGKRDAEGEIYETEYPYVVFHYTIAEDMTIKNSVGRAFLDKHTQEAVSSMMSSFVTAHRRASKQQQRFRQQPPKHRCYLQHKLHYSASPSSASTKSVSTYITREFLTV